MNGSEKAILVVSFGTSYEQTRKKTIDKIEETIQEACPDRKVYRAWTSGMILKKLNLRDGIHYDNVGEAMQHMIEAGVREVVVQPTHVVNGIEYEKILSEVSKYKDQFDKIVLGQPLLTTIQDRKEAVEVLMKEFGGLTEDEALVLMGHGTPHHANSIYTDLDHMFKEQGYDNVYVGTVEGSPELSDVIELIRKRAFQKIHLAPLMFVAGEHALNDMAGQENSWKTCFEAEGYSVECHLKGMGEYKGIREIVLRHLKETLLL